MDSIPSRSPDRARPNHSEGDDLLATRLDELEAQVDRLDALDPAEAAEPASRIADGLSELLDEDER